MIDIGKILKRAWQVLWNYKVLWIFAFLLALTAGGGGNSNGGSSYQFRGNTGYNGPEGYNPDIQSDPTLREMQVWFHDVVEPLFATEQTAIHTAIWITVGILALILVISLLTALVRYPVETAILRMVDNYEQTGEKVGFKAGWKMGWNKRAFRIWVIDLIIGIPAFLFVLAILAAGVVFFVSAINGNAQALAGGAMAALIGICGLSILLTILMVFLGLLRQFFVRKAALEETTVGESFRQGWDMFKRNWKSAALMWLVMLGIGIGFGIAAMIAFFLLIPAYIILAIPGAIVAAIPGAIAFGITSIFTSQSWLPWLIGALVALPFLVTIVASPTTLLSGLYMLFDANVWTLSYREMKALEALAPAAPVEELPPLAK